MTPSPPPDRRAIGVIGAYVEGWRRVLRAPAVWLGMLVVGIVSMFAPVAVVGVGVEAYRIAPIDVAGEASRAAKHLIYALPGLIDPSTDIVGAFEHEQFQAEDITGIWFIPETVVLLGSLLFAELAPTGPPAVQRGRSSSR